MGHLHLHVGDIEQGLAFYRDVLGFEVQANLGSAAFVSAGGYHHHLGFNVWRGRGVGPAPEHTAGLRHWTVELPTAPTSRPSARASRPPGAPSRPVDGGFLVRDPWRTAVRFVAAEDPSRHCEESHEHHHHRHRQHGSRHRHPALAGGHAVSLVGT